MPNSSSTQHLYRNISLLLFLFFVYLTIQTAWLSDDCYITLRTVRNFVEGYGLRWNIDERVQVYTHPLWMLLLSAVYFFTREAYFTTIFLSLFISWLAVVGLQKLAFSPQNLALGFLACCVSRAFLDYTTSGLENPLSYVLIGIFCWLFFRETHTKQHFRYLCLLGALLLVNRIDTSLLIFPALVYAFFQQKEGVASRIISVGLGFLPLMAWLVFATIYYGFPFPNTAYAKLYTGIANKEIFLQGFYYYLQSLSQDPITLIFIGLTSSLCFWEKKRKPLMMILGIALYFAYILKIGGDFMGGRFFSLPYFICVILFIRIDLLRIFSYYLPVFSKQKFYAFLSILLFQLGVCCCASQIPLLNHAVYRSEDFIFGIADERGYYFDYTGLINSLKRGKTSPSFPEITSAQNLATFFPSKVIVVGMVGMYGFYAPKEAHLIDQLALTDAMLARMKPPFTKRPMWRIGHISRFVPHGYIETVETGKNVIRDTTLAHLYEGLKTITQADIWSKKRWAVLSAYYKGDYQVYMGKILPQDCEYISPKQLLHYSQMKVFRDAAYNKSTFPAKKIDLVSDKAAFFGNKLFIENQDSVFFQREPHYDRGLYKITFSLKVKDNTEGDTLAKIETKLGSWYQKHYPPLKTLYLKGTDFKQKETFQSFEMYIPYSFSYLYLLTFQVTALSQQGLDCEYIRCEKIEE